VIPGPQELLDSVDRIGVRFGWSIFPTRKIVLRCRAEALSLNDDSGDPATEGAALFFSFAFDERRLGPHARGLLPLALTLHHLHDHRRYFRPADVALLGWLRHEVAEGSADWPYVRAWFIERVVVRERSV
jgi:hypothetical protein